MGLSGKCDFEDWVSMMTPEVVLSKYSIYAHNNDIVPLKMESEKDLVAYYPYLTSFIYSNKQDGGCVHLSNESFIDSEEHERMQWRLDDVIRYYKKCKRKKIPFNKNDAISQISMFDTDDLYLAEIVDRVEEFGTHATIDGIHDKWHDRMRKEWFDLMVESGWDNNAAGKWVYGLLRWMQMNTEGTNDHNN